MNIARIVHTVAQLDDGSFVVLNEAGETITTFNLDDFSDPTTPHDHVYAIRVVQIFRKIAADEL
nr:hypothetical protein [uncultured Rhodococcus sp.]